MIPAIQAFQSSETVFKTVLHPNAIAAFVRDNYFLTEPVTSDFVRIGLNDIYRIDTGGETYAFKLSGVYTTKTFPKPQLLFELEWLEYLKKQNIAVSYPICRKDNQLLAPLNTPEGPRFGTLFSFAEGSRRLSPEQGFILGKEVARLHLASNAFKTDLPRYHLDLNKLLYEPLEQIKDFFGAATEKIVFLDAVVEQLAKQISQVEITEHTYGVITGDLHGGNQHFTDDNKLTMFDFEYCAYGYRVYDLATLRWNRAAKDEALWESFLKGYQSIRLLTESELEAVDAFVKARHLWWLGYMIAAEAKYRLDDAFWTEKLAILV